MNQVKSFIEGEMEDGKEGTLKELVDNANKERAFKELEEASLDTVNQFAKVEFPKKGSAKKLMNWVLTGDTEKNIFNFKNPNEF